jgi:hypothetical protein
MRDAATNVVPAKAGTFAFSIDVMAGLVPAMTIVEHLHRVNSRIHYSR